MRATVLMLAVAVVLASCAGIRARDSLRSGMITQGQVQETFLSVWGRPDRTYTVAGEETTRAQWGGFGTQYAGGFSGNYSQGKQMLEVRVYESRKTEVAFNPQRRLVAWKSELRTDELATSEDD